MRRHRKVIVKASMRALTCLHSHDNRLNRIRNSSPGNVAICIKICAFITCSISIARFVRVFVVFVQNTISVAIFAAHQHIAISRRTGTQEVWVLR